MIYEYTKTSDPCVEMIRENVEASKMSDKSLKRFYDGKRTGDPVTHELTSVTFKVEFEKELSAADKTTFDGIVDTATGKHAVMDSSITMTKKILSGCSDQTQQERILDVLPTIDRAVDAGDYDLVQKVIATAFGKGLLLQADVDLINSIIPSSKWI